MPNLGFYSYEQYASLGSDRRKSGPRVAYNLLNTGQNPTEEQIRVFEDISFTLQTSNGTFRTTFRNRFQDVDQKAIEWIGQGIKNTEDVVVQDRAVSHGLTACEWAKKLFQAFPRVSFEASDLLTDLLELTLKDGSIYITEVDGTPLQYIRPPYVVSVYAPETWRNPWLRLISSRARSRFQRLSLPPDWFRTTEGPGYAIQRISCIHPEAAALMRSNPGFGFRKWSVFDSTPAACNVLRTMNILNRAYFSENQLRGGIGSIFESLRPGGIWIVGRTLETDFTNHVTFFRRTETGWKLLDRLGQGSEIEELALTQ